MEAVVSAAHGVMGPLLGKLADLLAGKYGRIRGVRGEILSLQAELTSMHAALKNYTMLEDPDVQVKAWISLLRELAYDTEDCIDKFIRRLGKRGRRGGFKEILRNTTRFLKTLDSCCGIADQIDELKARIKHIKELKDCSKLSEIPCSKTEHAGVDPRLCALFAEEAHLVGVEGPRDDLVKWMLKEENTSTKHPRVLSIVGFGGLGKTTLASEVYRKIEGHFDCRAFISVSQKPVIKKIIKDVIYKVPCPDGFIKDIEIWDEVTSIAKLRELLQDKRFSHTYIRITILGSSSSGLDAYQTTRCYNLMCSGFVQTNNQISIGGSISPVSTYGGTQHDFDIFVWKDPNGGNWWLQVGSINVGYWPSIIFSYFADRASTIMWGGEVFSGDAGQTSTQMGSGDFPEKGLNKSSHIKNIQVLDSSNYLKPPGDVGLITEQLTCYNMQNGTNGDWGTYIYYGGPGKNPTCP